MLCDHPCCMPRTSMTFSVGMGLLHVWIRRWRDSFFAVDCVEGMFSKWCAMGSAVSPQPSEESRSALEWREGGRSDSRAYWMLLILSGLSFSKKCTPGGGLSEPNCCGFLRCFGFRISMSPFRYGTSSSWDFWLDFSRDFSASGGDRSWCPFWWRSVPSRRTWPWP